MAVEQYNARPPETREPSLDDLGLEEELRLFHEARELEGPIAEHAKERLFMLSWPVIDRAAQRYRSTLGDAAYEDLLQDQRLNVLTLIERHDIEKGRFAAYVATYTKYDGLTAINEGKREIASLDDDRDMTAAKDRIVDTRQTVEDQVIEGQPRAAVDVSPLLETLPKEEREVIEMLIFDDEDLTRQDVARRLELSVATIGYRKARALERLLDSDKLPDILRKLRDTGDHEELVSGGLAKAVVERREIRIAQARERFMTERAAKRAREAAEREARPERIRQARLTRAAERARDIKQRRQNYKDQKLQEETELTERNEILAARRKLILQRLEEERRERLPELNSFFKDNPTAHSVLAYLHLSGDEAARLLGIKKHTLGVRVMRARQMVEAETRAELALWSLEHGVSYVVTEPPLMDAFTIRERLVASRLWRENPDIAGDLGITHKQVRTDVMSLLKKTGAQNRTELALIAQLYGFEPFPEELKDDTPEALKPFPEFQHEILKRLHLPYEVIAGELGMPRYSVQGSVRRSLNIAELSSNAALAFKLYKEGLEFNILEPRHPLYKILTKQELEIAQSLDKPYEEIALRQGIDDVERVHKLVGYMKTKTGARTRAELLLMSHVFDTGKSRPEYHNNRPREERFFEALGIDPVPMEDARAWLEYATPRQAEYIEAYYFSEEQLSWRAIGEQFIVHRITAMAAAIRGVEKIREQLKEQGLTKDRRSTNEAT